MTVTTATVELNIVANVGTVTLRRPEQMNALTPLVFAELNTALDEAIARGARVIVLTGEGRAFCAGADLHTDLPDDLGQLVNDYYNPLALKLAGLNVPLVSAINGPAAGAGVALALAADISVMARSAYLLLAFVNIGLVPDMGSTWLVAKAVGRTRALEMALLGERISAERADELGLVTKVVDDGDALREALDVAAKLAAGPSVAIGLIRQQVASSLCEPLDRTLSVERENQRRAGYTADFAEAVGAFGEKRPPRFKGR